MRPISKLLLSCGALAACLAPALQAELTGTHQSALKVPVSSATDTGKDQVEPEFLPEGSGGGAGIWIAPTESAGFANAQLYDGANRLRYIMRANLLPAGEGLPGMDQQGGFLGVLFKVDRNDNRTKAAESLGKWIRHPDGTGEFGVEIALATNDPHQPLMTIGQIEGALLPPGIMPLAEIDPVDPVEFPREGSAPAAVGQLVLQWVIPGA